MNGRERQRDAVTEPARTFRRPCRRPALLISGPASGAGKTTVTAALARHHRNRGRTVRVLKTGPDFLDPMILERASGAPVYQLDLWMGGEPHCRELLHRTALEADVILVEGVMGLFDGAPSSADLAAMFKLPVFAVIDASAMAQTFGAVAHGLRGYRPGLSFAGVVANRTAGAVHCEMLRASLPPDLPYFGAMPYDEAYALPERYLGLAQADEIADLELRLDRCAAALATTSTAGLPEAVSFEPPQTTTAPPSQLAGVRIAVARDEAFSFLYAANLDLLKAMGAELVYFSPLRDSVLPLADSLYLPGGYPELHLRRLTANTVMHAAIRAHHAAGKPIVAECGGMLYLLESLADPAGDSAPMAGILPGHARVQSRLANLGLQHVHLPEGELRGHTFHHSTMETSLAPVSYTADTGVGGRAEPVYRLGRLHASYLHLYLPSNPAAAAGLFAP